MPADTGLIPMRYVGDPAAAEEAYHERIIQYIREHPGANEAVADYMLRQAFAGRFVPSGVPGRPNAALPAG